MKVFIVKVFVADSPPQNVSVHWSRQQAADWIKRHRQDGQWHEIEEMRVERS